MESIINLRLKPVLLRAALCAIVSISVAAQCNVAHGEIVPPPRRGVAPRRIAPKPAPAPKPMAVARRRVPPPPPPTAKIPPNVAPRIAPNVAPKIAPIVASKFASKVAVGWRPIPIRNLEFVAHLRRELYLHRWSFIYAANLKHAPKRIRFLQNGTVETDLKGERWYWQVLDGRRVLLRTLADVNQPGITLEFNEGYTGFQYLLPDQSVAVQGAELDTIAQGPTLASSPDGGPITESTDSGPKTLEEALLAYPWNWNDVSGNSDAAVHFAKNKSFRVGSRTSFWNVTGPRTVHVEFENGDQTDLLFDTTFSDYTDGNKISGFRQNAASSVAASDIK